MRSHINKIYAVLAISAILIGCAESEFEPKVIGSDALTLTLHIDQVKTGSALRSVITPEHNETLVNSLYLLFFEDSDDESGLLKKVICMNDNITMETAMDIQTSGEILADNAYRIIAIGNLDSYVDEAEPWLNGWLNKPEIEFRHEAIIRLNGIEDETNYSANPINPNALLMKGETTKQKNRKHINITLSRNVVRIDVVNNAETHTLKTISVWNATKAASITGDEKVAFTHKKQSGGRFYGINANTDQALANRLYLFENYLDLPNECNNASLCLIMGMENNDTQELRYYRADIKYDTHNRLLKPNHAYRVAIISVANEGYKTENESCDEAANILLFAVNDWNLDDMGVVASDGVSMISVPSKMIRLSQVGGITTYNITTSSVLPNPEPLRIKSQSWVPNSGSITASIEDGRLKLESTEMEPGEGNRRGLITLSYAKLEATIEVIQSLESDKYLFLNTDKNWKGFLPPTANTMSEYVYVNASGAWTAKIISEHDNVAFLLNNEYSTTISSADVTDNRFRLYTKIQNNSLYETKKAFAVVSLDEDPQNYVAAVNVIQLGKTQIESSHDNGQSIKFYGSKYLIEQQPNLSYNQEYSFTVNSLGVIDQTGVKIEGADADKFSLSYMPGENGGASTVTIKPKEVNNTERQYMASIVVSDNKNGYMVTNVVQEHITLQILNHGKSFIPKGGGYLYANVYCNDPYIDYTPSITIDNSSALANHKISVEETDTHVNANKTFKVSFSKLYYPHRNVDVAATLTIKTGIDNIEASLNMTQEKLTPRDIYVWEPRSDYGAISNGDWSTFKSYLEHSLSRYSNGGVTSSCLDTSKATLAICGINGVNSWGAENEFADSIDGVMLISTNTDNESTRGALSDNNSVFKKKGFIINSSNIGDAAHRFNSDASQRRVYQFLMTHAISMSIGVDMMTINASRIDLTQWPNTAVPIIVCPSPESSSEIQAALVIDPQSRICYVSDSEMFNNNNLDNDRNRLAEAFAQYLIFSALYGSHFSDLLIDDSQLPPPWSHEWGEKRWQKGGNNE